MSTNQPEGTPRTDSRILHPATQWDEAVKADFARQLERELNEATSALTTARQELEAFKINLMNALHTHSTAEGDILAACNGLSKRVDVEIPALKAQLAAAEGGTKRLAKALRGIVIGTGCDVFLDGRNEHGTHILPGTLGNVDWTEVERVETENDPAFTENVFKEAEGAGFKAGDWVWLNWRRDPGQYNEEGRCEIAPYLEYAGVDKEISSAIRAARSAHPDKEEEGKAT